MGGNNSRPQKQAVPVDSGSIQRDVVQQNTQPDEPHYMTASGIPVVPRTQPSPVVAPDPVLQEFRAAYVEPSGHQSEMGSIASQVTPLAPHSTWFMRLVENHYSKSLIDQLILETNPQCRLNRLKRLRKIYTSPFIRLSAANRQRVKVIDAQIEELEFLMMNDDGKPFARYRSKDDEDPSPPSTDFSGSVEERPIPMIAQLADQQASESSDAGSGMRMIPYNRPLRRYLQESPRLPPRHATSSSHIRSGSIRLPSGSTVESRDWTEPRRYLRGSNNLSRVSEEASTGPSRVRFSKPGRSAPPPSVGPAVVLEPDPYNSKLMVPVEPSRRSQSRSNVSKDPSRHSRTTGRVSHKTASKYSEQIDVRPESRDPRFAPTGFGGVRGG
ncbi:hypothetical protein KCU99_g8000, partial [Aureobasidium melanogenum]